MATTVTATATALPRYRATPPRAHARPHAAAPVAPPPKPPTAFALASAHPPRPRAHTHTLATPLPAAPAAPPPYSPTPPRRAPARPQKSRSTPQLHALAALAPAAPASETEDDEALFAAPLPGGLRARLGGGSLGSLGRAEGKAITTAPGAACAGETETEADEPSRRLPTARILPSGTSRAPPGALATAIFEASRLLSIVPAVCGVLYNLYFAFDPGAHPSTASKHGPRLSRVDFCVSALWAVLTGVQCLQLTSALLVRWRVYYPAPATLVRLLALQALCWPLTHATLTVLNHDARPLACWALIGSTTCLSRAIVLWVTSNLWWDAGAGGGWRMKMGGRWGGRRWDWGEVTRRCLLPMGVCYFIMAWAEVGRREWEAAAGVR